jgi:catechol 2,3-dioxygenase-like lactoylglutathione lyase family enzyme
MKNNITKLIMFIMPVGDMPKMKEFYTGTMGFEITKEYRQDDAHWWTSIRVPGDGITVTMTTFGGQKTGAMSIYLLAPDIEAAHSDLSAKGATPTPVTPDLYGPGSVTKWFSLKDPEGNTWTIAEAEPK